MMTAIWSSVSSPGVNNNFVYFQQAVIGLVLDRTWGVSNTSIWIPTSLLAYVAVHLSLKPGKTSTKLSGCLRDATRGWSTISIAPDQWFPPGRIRSASLISHSCYYLFSAYNYSFLLFLPQLWYFSSRGYKNTAGYRYSLSSESCAAAWPWHKEMRFLCQWAILLGRGLRMESTSYRWRRACVPVFRQRAWRPHRSTLRMSVTRFHLGWPLFFYTPDRWAWTHKVGFLLRPHQTLGCLLDRPEPPQDIFWRSRGHRRQPFLTCNTAHK